MDSAQATVVAPAPQAEAVTSPPEAAELEATPISTRLAKTAWWLVRFALALFLFVGALQLMKTGASGLDVLQHEGMLVKNAGSTLGLGWLGALLVLSGSPIAADHLAHRRLRVRMRARGRNPIPARAK